MFRNAREFYKQMNKHNVKNNIQENVYLNDAAYIFNNDVYNFKRLTEFNKNDEFNISDEELKQILNEVKADIEINRKIKKEQKKK